MITFTVDRKHDVFKPVLEQVLSQDLRESARDHPRRILENAAAPCTQYNPPDAMEQERRENEPYAALGFRIIAFAETSVHELGSPQCRRTNAAERTHFLPLEKAEWFLCLGRVADAVHVSDERDVGGAPESFDVGDRGAPSDVLLLPRRPRERAAPEVLLGRKHERPVGLGCDAGELVHGTQHIIFDNVDGRVF